MNALQSLSQANRLSRDIQNPAGALERRATAAVPGISQARRLERDVTNPIGALERRGEAVIPGLGQARSLERNVQNPVGALERRGPSAIADLIGIGAAAGAAKSGDQRQNLVTDSVGRRSGGPERVSRNVTGAVLPILAGAGADEAVASRRRNKSRSRHHWPPSDAALSRPRWRGASAYEPGTTFTTKPVGEVDSDPRFQVVRQARPATSSGFDDMALAGRAMDNHELADRYKRLVVSENEWRTYALELETRAYRTEMERREMAAGADKRNGALRDVIEVEVKNERHRRREEKDYEVAIVQEADGKERRVRFALPDGSYRRTSGGRMPKHKRARSSVRDLI